MKLKLNFIKEEKFILILPALFVFILNCWHFNRLNGIYVLHDEFGYWAIAAKMAGYDWSGMMETVPFYSYGYSFLLMPLFFIFHDMSAMYRAAIIMNALMQVGSFCLSFVCAKRFFTEDNKIQMAICCFIVSLYPANISNSHIGWSETLLYFLFWILLYLMMVMFEKPSYCKLSAICIVTVYTYMVHQRTLAIVIAVVISLTYYFCREKKYKYIKVLFIWMAVLFVFQLWLKGYVINSIWGNVETESLGNDYSSVIGSVKELLLSVNGLFLLVKSCIRKGFYLCTASASVIFLFCLTAGKKVYQYFKEKSSNMEYYMFSFLILALLGVWGLCSIAMASEGKGRVDLGLYGRYMENIIGPYMLIGLANIKIELNWKRTSLLYIISLGAATYIAWILAKEKVIMVMQNTVGLSLFYNPKTAPNPYFPWNAYLIIILIFCLLQIIVHVKKYKWAKEFSWLVIGGLWLIVGIFMCKDIIFPCHKEEISDYRMAAEFVDKIDCSKIYCVRANTYELDRIQYFLPYRNVQEINNYKDETKDSALRNEEELDNVLSKEEKDAIFIFKKDDYSYYEYLDKFPIIYISNNVVILAPLDGYVVEEKGMELYSSNGLVKYNFQTCNRDSSNIMESGNLLSDGSSGYMCWGNMFSFKKGKCVIEIDLKLHEYTQTNIATIDINSSNGVLYTRDIASSDFENGTLKEKIELDIHELTNNIEIRVYSHEGNIIELKEILYGLNQNL